MSDQEEQQQRLKTILRILDELRVQTKDGLPDSPAMDALIREIDNLNGSRVWHERFSFVDDAGKKEQALKVLQALVEKERESPTLH
ncbi:MAG: hypothetical protein HQL84_13115 [Magnetococcales bacterium]|nr:hypothetical protein [Magnetococcales bacterium]MBF0150973.1 hypothetical protein [Magnetococcales bacterium]MBF0174036.1 hypothetical protein [Magnetococcales bacterium]MBF0346692.1 hypothetical protein [Magnetococcales bacterium]MBF0629908.1 hypothetical protein [Magnetococcales bacterium]